MKHSLIKILSLESEVEKGKRLKECSRIFLSVLAIHIIFTTIGLIAAKFDLYIKSKHPNSVLIENTEDWQALFLIFFSSTIIHPLTEELSFRFSNSIQSNQVLLGFCFMSAFVLTLFFDLNELLFTAKIPFSLFIIGLGLATYLLLRIVVPQHKFSTSGLFIIIILSNLVFALVHLNVNSTQENLLGYFIILFPFFFVGCLYSYARITMGFSYAFLCHAMNNGFFFFLNLIMK